VIAGLLLSGVEIGPRDAVALAVDVFSDRSTFLILREAFYGVRRFGQMQRNLGIARNVLADRLRQLVGDGMLERVRYRTDPDWYEYRLTERALDLYPVIDPVGWPRSRVRRPEHGRPTQPRRLCLRDLLASGRHRPGPIPDRPHLYRPAEGHGW
jgi:DNA-binding HxlR family transcriptional regulator